MAKSKYLGIFYTFIFSFFQGFGLIYIFFSLLYIPFFSIYEGKELIHFVDQGILISLLLAFLIGRGIGEDRGNLTSIFFALITTTVLSISLFLFFKTPTNYEEAGELVIKAKVNLGLMLLFTSTIASILPTLLTTYLTQKLLKYHLD